VARILRRLSDGRWEITISGHLGAADLLRLERPCAPALDRRPLPLDLDLERLIGVDRIARLFLSRLQDRGAALVMNSGEAAVSFRTPEHRARDSSL
jgi:hypothetical protein